MALWKEARSQRGDQSYLGESRTHYRAAPRVQGKEDSMLLEEPGERVY